MTKVSVPVPRSNIADTPGGLEVTIPAKRSAFLILFLGFWMVGWCFGEVTVLRQLLTGDGAHRFNLFLIAWLGAWTVGGGVAGFLWLWMVFGKERIGLRRDALTTKKDILGFGRVREYDLLHVSHLRVAPITFNPFDFSAALQLWGLGGGPIAFDYGAKTFRCGASIDEPEARDVVKRLRERHQFAD